MSAPRTTILVPSIGRVEFLTDTWNSLEAQTRQDFEVLVLDNASPPAAQAIFDGWAKKDARVKVLRADPRVPMFSNFNRGLRAVKTPFVTFFHDDDSYDRRYLEVLVGSLEQNPSAQFAGSNFDFIDDTGEVIEKRRWIATTEVWSGTRYVRELVGRGRNPVPMPGLVFRRSAIGPDGFDENLPIHFGDFVLLMRYAENGGMMACAEPVVRIRKHAGQASAMKLSKSVVLRTELMSRYLDEYADRHPEDVRTVAALRSRIVFAHRAAMLWGWLSDDDASERDACLDALGARAPDALVRGALRWADKKGLRPPGLGAKLVRVARSAAETLRL